MTVTNAAPRRPAAIADRTALIEQLSVACELEQGLCIQYLFTAFSLKDSAAEGLSGDALTTVRKWKANILHVAAQEMLHLAQAANLLAAIGGTVQLRRPNFPQSRDYYPTGLPWGLLPFSRETVRLYAVYERPDPLDAELRAYLGDFRFDEAALFEERPELWALKMQARNALPARLAEQQEQATAFETIGELYAAIERAFAELDQPTGSLFIGQPQAQVDGDLVDFPQLIEVRDTHGAAKAVNLIVKQGEGGASDHRDSHFSIFVGILRDFDRLQALDPDFAPARDVHPNPLSRLHVDNTHPGWRLIEDAFTRSANDLTTDVYQTMMLALYRLFATSGEAPAQRRLLARTALYAMATVVKPLGEAMTRLPMGDPEADARAGRPGCAGASFEIERTIQLMPHQPSTWTYLAERLAELAARAQALSLQARATPAYAAAAADLQSAAVTLGRLGQAFSTPDAAPATQGDRR